ncbi:DUF5131 family protein [Mesorhizobium sp. M4A.F.Ca.ET.090.04.2.1]|uniref:DUF5131 family protein n=1 Tax=Mesorhizobium sp. M4A.F.Ca.ET.090.04.2.1 TaxID=2496663 RepID=UPI000FCB4FCA|nr:DUF5131 family protein [Mesorhizobium sp. M4A.F.Ca.ET.090.04.2.1]RVC47626.1 DUF5131 family protein [Mesorhizobium sp. M4A.F.Ca.ET.090.04.2.1]
MGEITAISWCDMTHNHWIGCSKVSIACDGCYAEAMMDKRYHRVEWGGPGKGAGTRVLTSEANRRKPLAWNRKAAEAGTRPFVFCSSLADVFDNQVPTAWRTDLFELIRATPNLIWLLLTKRPQNIVRMYGAAFDMPWPRNAAIGTTVEDQERAINLFHLACAARDLERPAFTFASFEPLLGPVDPTRIVIHEGPAKFVDWPEVTTGIVTFNSLLGAPSIKLPPLGWAITGGETDQGEHRARPTHPLWFRQLRDQCTAAGVAFHHKQNGEWAPGRDAPDLWRFDEATILPDGRVREWQEDYPQARLVHPDMVAMRKIGKRRSGRLLDGIEHNARPEVAA